VTTLAPKDDNPLWSFFMGKYTAIENNSIDQKIATDLQIIVETIRSHMEPEAIILRGSFGRGEGSVLVQNGQLNFLSDYEIDVMTPSARYRSLFSQLSHQLTKELGVDTGLRWVRPDYLQVERVGPFSAGKATITISLYESRYGAVTLYGQRGNSSEIHVDPRQIQLLDAFLLLLNRMAESLYHIPLNNDQIADAGPQAYYWVNKLILACTESLLAVWGKYHFSYRERGRRLLDAGQRGHLDFMTDQAEQFMEMVTTATAFKLQPDPTLYKHSIQETWQQVVPIVDRVFRYLAHKIWGFTFELYAEFPAQFLRNTSIFSGFMPLIQIGFIKVRDVYKYARVGLFPRSTLRPYITSGIIYSAVPLVFTSWLNYETEKAAPVLQAARHYLNMAYPILTPSAEGYEEWLTLQQSLLLAWKNFCYL
jgi:hypothetical protein